MNKISLKQGIQNQVKTIELNSDQLGKLMDIQESNKKGNGYFKQALIKRIVAIAATIVLAITIGFLASNQQPPIGEKIAYEVSKNHLKLKPLEVNSSHLNDLRSYFTMLDFNLVNTQILSDSNWRLLGARYCSIQGNTAAQLRLENNQTGSVETLYQAPFNAQQFSNIPILENDQPPLEEFAKGMSIKIWVEKGVLFALTNNNLGS